MGGPAEGVGSRGWGEPAWKDKADHGEYQGPIDSIKRLLKDGANHGERRGPIAAVAVAVQLKVDCRWA